MSSPEWVEYGRTWREFQREDLHQPGTLIQSGPWTALIGDVNRDSGTCGCCNSLGDSEVIDRYAVLVEKDW